MDTTALVETSQFKKRNFSVRFSDVPIDQTELLAAFDFHGIEAPVLPRGVSRR